MNPCMTVGDLLRVLEQMPKDRQVVLSTDGGGTIHKVLWYVTAVRKTDDESLTAAEQEELSEGLSRDVFVLGPDTKKPELKRAVRFQKTAKKATSRFLKAMGDNPVSVGEKQCRSCRGYGYFNGAGRPTIDRRGRPCSDCRGTGEVG